MRLAVRITALLLPIIALCRQESFSQDSLVRINDLKFSSEFERVHFTGYLKDSGRNHLLSLLLATNPNGNEESSGKVRNEINAMENTLIIGGIDKRKPGKKIKEVYDFVHRTTLKKYELECQFEQVFQTGIYNCVTATALYSVIFDDLKIPYEIKEKPTHVYLLAYPNQENIMVETTSPLFGYLTFNDDYKQRFLNTLKNQKIIGADDVAKKTTDELFNQYYFLSENIDLRKLVGIHYMNDAIFKKDKDKIEEAYRQLEKSYLLYPSPRCEFLLMSFGVDVVSRVKLPPKDKAVLVAKVSRYKDEGITVDMIKGEFFGICQEVLLRENNRALFKECYEIMMSSIHDQEMRDEISFIYYYENGRTYFNQENYQMAKPYFEKALRLQPNNIDLNKIFVAVIGQSFRHMEDNRTLLDSITYYHTTFPALSQYNSFNSYFASANLLQFQNEFVAGHPEEGNKYRKVFEEEYRLHTDLNIRMSEIGSAYAAGVRYYVRKGQKAKAKELLDKGLALSANSYELMNLKQSVK